MVAFFALAARAQTVWHVDDDGSPGNGCTSWLDACPDLQTALGLASGGDQVWVATGTYKPASGTDRAGTFQLMTGVEVYGGFDGTESTLGERAGLFGQTILSGDLAGDDTPLVCVDDSPDCDSNGGLCVDGSCIIKQNNGENSYHVVTGSSTDVTAVLDGFTVTGGNAAHADAPDYLGGGMYNHQGSPRVANCTFRGNAARYLGTNQAGMGGGMYNAYSNPTVTRCTFSGNTAGGEGMYGFGGGMANVSSSSPTVTHCTFSGNTADWVGGGMANRIYSSPTVTNCTFNGNAADGEGGGMDNWDFSDPAVTDCMFSGNHAGFGGGMGNNDYSDPTVTNCKFSGNTADWGAGGMGNYDSSPTVTNCAFSGNTADDGGGMSNRDSSPAVTNCTFSGNTATNGGGMSNRGSNLTVTNCTFCGNTAVDGNAVACDSPAQRYPSTVQMANNILWDGGDEIRNNDTSTIIITYSSVQDDRPDDGVVYPGTGNIDTDPVFSWMLDPDPDGRRGTGNDVGDVRLAAGSPCVDTGDNQSIPPDTADLDHDGDTAESIPIDLDGHARVLCDTVDMGAYESGIGDHQCDRDVDLDDFTAWDTCMTGPGSGPYDIVCQPFDFDYDGDVDLTDFAGLQVQFTNP